MVHGTRSKGKAKAITIVELSDSDVEIVPSPVKKSAAVVAPPSPAPPSPAPAFQRQPSTSLPPTRNVSPPKQQRDSSSESPVKAPRPRATRLPSRTASVEPHVASTSSYSARTSLPPVASTSSTISGSTSKPTSAPARAKAPRGGARKKEDADEDAIDDFFTRKTTKPTVAKGRVPKARATSAAAAPPPPPPKSDTPDDDDSSGDSGDDGKADKGGLVTKPVVLPDWAKTKTGADKARGEKGFKPNRKRRKITDPDTDDEEAQDKDKDSDAGPVPPPESDSDSSSDDSIGDFEAPKLDKGKGKGRGPTRELSASLSPKPAPQSHATEFQAWTAQQLLHKASDDDLAARGNSPAALPDLTDLDPELAELLRNDLEGSDDIQIVSNNREASALATDEPEEDVDPTQEVEIRISQVWDPERAAPPQVMAVFERPVPITTTIKEPFETIFAQFAMTKGLAQSQLVFTYRNARVYPFGTPNSLKIYHSADLKAYLTEVYEKIQRGRKDRVVAAKRVESPPPEEDAIVDDDNDNEPAREASREPSVAQAAAPGGGGGGGGDSDDEGAGRAGMINVKVRGSATMVLDALFKPTHKIATLLRAYCKQFDIDVAKVPSMWAEFDGERLDSQKTLAEYDEIEDGEAIDVRGAK
ncbi:hypothetical protein RQP46_002716 [Phenoliferia psychrophenolica]